MHILIHQLGRNHQHLQHQGLEGVFSGISDKLQLAIDEKDDAFGSKWFAEMKRKSCPLRFATF